MSKYTFDTVNTRGRKREARRWREVLAARCTNGAHQLHPLKGVELFQIRERAMAELERQDRVLFAAVHQCSWDQMMADSGITMDQWRRRALRRADRVNAIRRTLSPQIGLSDVRYVRRQNRAA